MDHCLRPIKINIQIVSNLCPIRCIPGHISGKSSIAAERQGLLMCLLVFGHLLCKEYLCTSGPGCSKADLLNPGLA